MALATALLIAAGVVAYGLTYTDRSCLPQVPEARPSSARAGEAVAVSSAGLGYDRRLPAGTIYRVSAERAGAGGVELATVPVAQDGRFQVTVRIPPGTGPGRLYLEISGSLYDDCEDTTSSCVGYGVLLTVLPPPTGAAAPGSPGPAPRSPASTGRPQARCEVPQTQRVEVTDRGERTVGREAHRAVAGRRRTSPVSAPGPTLLPSHRPTMN